jgi:hypothetical protein
VPLEYQKEERLRELYHDQGLSMKEVGERLGCTAPTVQKWMEEHGIEKRAPAHERDWSGQASPRWVPYAGYSTGTSGYEAWHSRADDRATVSVHRLACVAWYGLDAVVGHDVHHVNGVPWDNREENVALMDPAAHRSYHAKLQGEGYHDPP